MLFLVSEKTKSEMAKHIELVCRVHTKRQVIIKLTSSICDIYITAVCVLFLIKLRWPKNKSIYESNY